MKTHNLYSVTLLVFATCIFLAGCESTTGPENIVRQFKNNQMISIVFVTDSETVSRIVPAQYQVPESNEFNLKIGTQNDSDGTILHQLFIQIPVKINGKEGSFVPVSFVDSSAEFELMIDSNKLHYRVSIGATEIANADYTMTNPVSTGNTIDEMMFANPSNSGELFKFYVTDFVMTKMFEMSGNFTLNLPSPMSAIPVRTIMQAHYFECDYNIRQRSNLK
jgi:hypothetical protein